LPSAKVDADVFENILKCMGLNFDKENGIIRCINQDAKSLKMTTDLVTKRIKANKKNGKYTFVFML